MPLYSAVFTKICQRRYLFNAPDSTPQFMKPTSIHIEKFRAIRKSDIRIDKELALVGQNSAGKSSILRALNAFFNFGDEKAAFESERHSFQRTSTTVIELGFVDVPVACTLPRVVQGAPEVRARLRYKKIATWQVFDNGSWITAPQDLHAELGKYVRYVYVPLRRDHEVAGWESGGLLKTAVEAWLEHHTSKRDSISPKVAELGLAIKQRALNGLSKQLRKITPLSGSFTFDLEYTKQPDYSLLVRDLILRVTEGGTTVDLEDCGSGTQSMTAFALYSYLAELKGSTYILGIEEPEQNLHPQAQRELLSNLRDLELQILFTTHSTVMLDELKHHEVVLCRRIASATRGIETITTQLPMDFWANTGLDESKYYQFHRRRNSDFFFADFVILTESPIDSEIVGLLLNKAGTDPKANGVSILCVDGVTSLPYAYQLLKALNFAFATVVDKDYFIPYLQDELDKSRDNRGFPKYRKEFKADTLLEIMVPLAAERTKLLNLFFSNHSRAMDILEASNVFCFKWSMEVDLVNSNTAQNLMFDELNIPDAQRNTNALLVTRKKAIKGLELLKPVILNLAPANLPNSYNRLRRALPGLIKQARSIRTS